ncbi:hypothetical protein SETIT_9G314000v2 [Setaria italica]|uniref:NAC domain-containing protein n=1 Tax=Setaria italica TaxID=4555 RepID=K4ABP4_SETIT|nr:hypothetical protein SETIT_9G314000v2 [Setaria italica]
MGTMTLPPGFRFHPTDDELVGYYLKRKVDNLKIELEVIPVIDLYKSEPWELPEKSFLPKRDLEWFFFCPRDRKYPNGSRTNRATATGYWKATGKDRRIACDGGVYGLRKTLVFYRGRAPGGERTDWVMHEYRLCQDLAHGACNFIGAYALCRVIKRHEAGLLQGEPTAAKAKGASNAAGAARGQMSKGLQQLVPLQQRAAQRVHTHQFQPAASYSGHQQHVPEPPRVRRRRDGDGHHRAAVEPAAPAPVRAQQPPVPARRVFHRRRLPRRGRERVAFALHRRRRRHGDGRRGARPEMGQLDNLPKHLLKWCRGVEHGGEPDAVQAGERRRRRRRPGGVLLLGRDQDRVLISRGPAKRRTWFACS